MTSNQIKARLIERGIKIKDIACKAKVSPTTVSIVLTGKGKSRHIQTVIAKAIKRPYGQVWGKVA
jgi:lambda repressor-like predicted transcriptional regulator